MDQIFVYLDWAWTQVSDDQTSRGILTLIAIIGGATAVFTFFARLLRRRREGEQRPDIAPPKIDQLVEAKVADALERELKQRRVTLDESIETAPQEDRAQLLAQKAEVERRLADVEGTLRERETKIAELTDLLRREGNEIGGDRLQHAIDALERGDFSEADEIFAEIEARDQPAVDRTARAAFGRGEIAEEQIRWLDAAEHYKRAATLAPDYDRLAKAGTFLWRAGRSGEAMRFNEDLVTLSKRVHGEKAAETATALNNLALRYKALGRYEESEPLYRQAIEIGVTSIGKKHRYYATRLNNLANLLKDMGRYEEAEPLYREAIEIGEATNGTAHPNYAGSLNNLASLLKDMGRYEEAEPLYRQAIDLGGASIGNLHPDYAVFLNNLAGMLRVMDRYEEAESLYRQAIEIDEAKIGTTHPTYATHLNNLANLLRDMDRYEEAEPLYRQAIEIDEATIGTAHPYYATHLNNLADLLWYMGRYEVVEPLYDQAVAILEDRLRAEHPTTIKVKANREAFRVVRAAAGY
ncbi:MAG: tetratricopeptide repeat protein [Pseudomonadota bacterium]